jgi:hypothetical protein
VHSAARLPSADGVALKLDDRGQPHLEPANEALNEIVAIVVGAMLDGSWRRACRNCRWCLRRPT